MKRNLKREKWMTLFEAALVQIEPAFAGRINWDAAAFHFNQGNSPAMAATKVALSEKPPIAENRQ